MDFKTKELRNNNNSLLRRIQRQVDKNKSFEIEEDEEDDFKVLKVKTNKVTLDDFPKKVMKDTKLHLFNNRRVNR